MNHRPHNRLVDAQAESDRTHHDANLIAHPFFLILAPGERIHLSMVGNRGNAVFLQEIYGFTDASDSRCVNDDAAVRDSTDGLEQYLHLRFRVTLAHDIAVIGAPETGDVLERVAKMELLDDVLAHRARGACRKRCDGMVGKEVAQPAQLPVLGPEVVAPFGNTVSLIDGKEGNGHFFEPIRGSVEGDAFGRKIKQTIRPFARLSQSLVPFPARNRTIDKARWDSHLRELRGLVLHQGNQWGDDYRRSLLVEDRRQLVAQGLAAAGGHDHAGVATRNNAMHNLFLPWAKRFVAPIPL